MEDNPGEIVTKQNLPSIFSKAWYRAMTPKTLSASFSATGVCPFNREAIQVPEETGSTKELDIGVISYLPLYSPAPKRYTAQNAAVSSSEDELVEVPITESKFSPAEEAPFQTRWENGYDLTTDHRYNQWVATKKAKGDEEGKSCIVTAKESKDKSVIQELLRIPEIPSALKKNSEKSFRSARVLTSEARLQQIKEKERKKREEEEARMCRRKEREERARQKAEERLSAKRKLEERRLENEQTRRQKEKTPVKTCKGKEKM